MNKHVKAGDDIPFLQYLLEYLICKLPKLL